MEWHFKGTVLGIGPQANERKGPSLEIGPQARDSSWEYWKLELHEDQFLTLHMIMDIVGKVSVNFRIILYSFY